SMPTVVREEQILPVPPDVSRSAALENVLVHAIAVDVVHEERVSILGRKRVAEIDHRSAVRVSSARRARAVVPGVRIAAEEVDVIPDVLEVVVDRVAKMEARLALVTRALDHVVEVRDDAGRHERLAVVVPVDAPRVARSPREDLEHAARRVIAPNAGVHAHTVLPGRPRLSDARVVEDAVTAVEPAIGPPAKRVRRLVRVADVEAVEEDLRRAVGLVVAVLVGKEEKVRRRADPYAAEPDLDAADEVEILREDRLRFVRAVEVRVGEDHDAIASGVPRALEPSDALGIRMGLGDPQPAARIERERDGLMDARLGGDEIDLEAF